MAITAVRCFQWHALQGEDRMKSIYMDERWEKLQEVKEGGVAYRYIHEADGTRIVYPFIKRAAGIVNGIDYYDIVTPRGVAGIWFENADPASSSEIPYRKAVQGFQTEFTALCAEQRIIAEFVRFSPWSDDYKAFSDTYRMREYGTNYCNRLTCNFFDEEYPARKRSKIRKMQREGARISFGKDATYIENFLNLYTNTQEKYNVSEYHRLNESFIQRYLETFPEEVIFAQAHFDEKVIVSALILQGPDIAHFHFGGSDPAYHHLDANSLLLYEAALFAAEKGMKMFDLGDALPGSALERFKQNTAKGYPYLVGTKIQNENIYQQLVEKAGGPRIGYFPEYRR